MADNGAVEKWQKIREEEIEAKLAAQEEQMEGEGDEMIDEQQRMALLEEEDYRGYYLPNDVKNSVLFTRTQFLQLINRKRELDEEQV
jgi:hypothetical protein